MSVKTVECVLCTETVTKRSTLSLRELGSTLSGRACRSHTAVSALKDEFIRTTELARLAKESDEVFQVIQAVAWVRMSHSLRGFPVDYLYRKLRQSGMSQQVMTRVHDGIEKLGGPLLSEPEVAEAFHMAAYLSEKRIAASGKE